jgi:hypothetical protein
VAFSGNVSEPMFELSRLILHYSIYLGKKVLL